MAEYFPVFEKNRDAPLYGGLVLASLAEVPDMRYASKPDEEGTTTTTNGSTRDMTGPDNYGKYDSTPDTEPDTRPD